MIIQTSATYKLETFTYSNNSTYSIYKGEGSWTNNLGDYVIEGAGKKIKINPIIVNQKSLQEFKGFTRTLSIATEIH